MKFSLRNKFLIPTLALVVAGMTVAVVVSYVTSKNALEQEAIHEMTAYAQTASDNLEAWIERNEIDLSLWAGQDVYANAVPDTFVGRSAREEANKVLLELDETYGFYELVYLANLNGDLVAASNTRVIGNINVAKREYFQTAAKGTPNISKVDRSLDTGNPFFALAHPVRVDDQTVGVLVSVVDLSRFTDTLLSRIQVGETGHAFIYNGEGVVIAHPDKGRILEQNLSEEAYGSRFLGKTEGMVDYEDKGVAMLATIQPVGARDWTAAVVAPNAELFESAQSVRNNLVFIGILVVVILGLGMWFMTDSFIIRPVRRVADSLRDIAEGEGDLTTRLEVNTSDEIGELSGWFNTFIDKLQGMIRELLEGANTLASATSQISSTSSEFATSSMETSSSVSEISTTAEEVKQTVQTSVEKAETVAEGAETVSKVAGRGRKATEDAIAGMNRIKEEMEYVAESIVKLSEQTQSIGEIINAVNDVANQSNLLSVNASIEAAKAGEYGKGFAVVAQEVKSLSDESKVATEQVRNILNEIQKATSAAVMATERGAKAVEAGVDLSAQSGEAIAALARSIEESVQAATQIAASSRQQMVGMDQLVEAMESIKLGTSNNAEGAKQLEESSANLAELGDTLSSLVGRFKA
ncbi:MAG: methyl-accepting chemotaxis protein [Desulfatibacillaceae bacterium]